MREISLLAKTVRIRIILPLFNIIYVNVYSFSSKNGHQKHITFVFIYTSFLFYIEIYRETMNIFSTFSEFMEHNVAVLR